MGAVLTTRGRCLLAGGVATAVCAVPLDERDLLRAGVVVALLPLFALLLTVLGRRTVRVHRTLDPARVPVGGTATVTVTVRGGGLLGSLDLADAVPDAAGAAGPTTASLPTGVPRGAGGAVIGYPLRPVLRGAHRVGPLVARGVDPLGLAEFSRTAPGTDRLLVLPRVVALRGTPRAVGSADGAHATGVLGAGQGRSDVHVRPYRSGDELRRVHWRSTARHDELMVRLEERSGRAGLTVLLDRRAQAHRGHGADASLEWAVTLAAGAVAHLLGRGDPVGLVTEDGAPVAAGSADEVLDALAVLRPSARADLDGPALPAGGDLLAVLGAAGPADVDALLARRPGGGHAVLLDVATWGGTPVAPLAATAAALRHAGWTVAVAARGARPDAVWAELVAGPAPRAVAT